MGKYKVIRVHEKFADSLEKEKARIEKETGVKLSMPEFTKILVSTSPIVARKKNKKIVFGFDF